jgi:hypothetical protein
MSIARMLPGLEETLDDFEADGGNPGCAAGWFGISCFCAGGSVG